VADRQIDLYRTHDVVVADSTFDVTALTSAAATLQAGQ